MHCPYLFLQHAALGSPGGARSWLRDLGIWAYGLGEGGTLGLVDYLSTAFGLFVPGVALVAAAAAAWGAGSGPVQR